LLIYFILVPFNYFVAYYKIHFNQSCYNLHIYDSKVFHGMIGNSWVDYTDFIAFVRIR